MPVKKQSLKVKTKKTPKKPVKKINRPDHISVSQILVGRCLLKYKLIRLDKSIKSDSVPARVGACVHDIIHRYTDTCCIEKTESDYETLLKIIESSFNKFYLPEEEYQDIRKNSIIFGERGVEFDKILEYEKHETVEFEKGKFIILIIDRTNLYKDHDKGTILEIIDYKNSMKIFTKQDVESLEQGLIYTYIACKFLYPNIDYVRFGIHQTRYDFVRWTELKKISDMTDQFDNTAAYLLRQWDRLILSEKLEPCKSIECWIYGGCEVMAANKCPLFSKAEIKRLMVGKISDKINASRKLKFDVKTLEDQARAHYSNKPPEMIAGKQVGYEAKISYKYDLVGFLKYCEKHEISLDGMEISKSEAEKAINLVKPIRKMDEDDTRELSEIQIEMATNKFNI